jgi:hypothetical protein
MFPLPHLTTCTHYLANSQSTVVSEAALYRLLTFQLPNLMFLFHRLGRTEESVQVSVS